MSTKLFRFISKHGHEIAGKRAEKSNSDYAERERIRQETKPGFIIVSEGPGGIDGYFEDMLYSHKFRPWWLKISLHIHWWLEEHGPRATINTLQARIQRSKKGWSVSDTWCLHTHLAVVIRDSVQHLRDNLHGWPGEPMTFEEWKTILSQIVEGMQAAIDLDAHNFDYENIVQEELLKEKHNLAMEHLTKYWFHLWD